MATTDSLITEIRAQVAGISKSMSSMRVQLADAQNIGKGSAVTAAGFSVDSSSLSNAFREVSGLISDSGQKSLQTVKDISQKYKSLARELVSKDMFSGILNATESVFSDAKENIGKYSEVAQNAFSSIKDGAKSIDISGMSNVFDNTKVGEYLSSLKQVVNLQKLSSENNNIQNGIAKVSAQVKEQVSAVSASMKNKVTDRVTDLKMSNFGTNLTSAVTGIGNLKPAGFEAKNSDNNILNSEIGKTTLSDILNELKAIESAIRGTRQFEKKVLA